jgi:putative ABC transport system ATP-binding protein
MLAEGKNAINAMQAENIGNDVPVIRLRNVLKSYPKQIKPAFSLSGAIEVPLNKFVVVLGYSGSGKTTFLNLMGALDVLESSPGDNVESKNAGDISREITFQFMDGKKVNLCESSKKGANRAKSEIRRRLGYVFQDGYLMDNLTNRENIEISLGINGKAVDPDYLSELADSIGISEDQLDRRPVGVSGGQAQRIAILRAVVRDPEVILADEPTSRVDVDQGDAILEMLRGWLEGRISRTGVGSVVCVMHNLEQAIKYGEYFIVLSNGEVSGSFEPSQDQSPDERMHYILELMRSGEGHSDVGIRSVGAPHLNEMNRVRYGIEFVSSFIAGELFPKLSDQEKGIWIERMLGRRLPQILNILIVFFLMLFSILIINIGWMFKDGLLQEVADPRLNGIPIGGVEDTERRLTTDLVLELGGLGWLGAEIMTPSRARERDGEITDLVVSEAHGTRSRPVYMQLSPNKVGALVNIRTVSLQTRDPDDPVLRVHPVRELGPSVLLPEPPATLFNLFQSVEDTCRGPTDDRSPLSTCEGVIVTWRTLTQLGFAGVPESVVLQDAPEAGGPGDLVAPVLAVVDQLPDGQGALVLNSYWERKLYNDSNFSGTVPAFDSIVIYVHDLRTNGKAIMAALEAEGFSVGYLAERLSVTLNIIGLIDVFLFAAISVVLVLSVVALCISFLSAVKRRQREIAVLIAFGIGRGLLRTAVSGMVGVVWLIGLMLALVVAFFLQTAAIEPIVGYVLELSDSTKIGGGGMAPAGVLGGTVVGMLLLAVIAVLWAVEGILRKPPAEAMKNTD